MQSAPLIPGTHIGGFRLGPLLARGGCSLAFTATAPDGADAVVKVPRDPGLCPPSALVNEARMARRVGPCHAPVVLAVDADAPVPFIALGRVPGRTLLAVLDERGPLCALAAIALARGLGGALDAFHAAGVAHLDVAPANVIVMPHGGVRLVDLAGGAVIGTPAPGQALGTPGYVAPERLAGMTSTAGMDVFAFAAVLYRALAGAAPGVHPATRGPRGRAVRIDAVRPELGREVGDVLHAGLHPCPARRPCTPGELASWFAQAMPVPADVAQWHQHHPVLTPATT